MELTERQKESIENIKIHQGITEVDDIIKWCLLKLSLPGRRKKPGGGLPWRMHGRDHYQAILEYCLEQKKKKPPLAQFREEALRLDKQNKTL